MAVKQIVGATLAALLVTSPVLAAAGDTVRAADTAVSTVAPAGAGKAMRAGTRVGSQVGQKNALLGAPLFLAFLGAVAVTIGTIIIVNNNGSSSPGG